MTNKILEQKLVELGANYLASLSSKLNELVTSYNGLKSAWNEKDCQQLQFDAHALSGSGSMLGFDELSSVLKKIDRLLKPCVAKPDSADPDILSKLNTYFSELKAAYTVLSTQNQDSATLKSHAENVAKTVETPEQNIPSLATNPAAEKTPNGDTVKIVLIDDDVAVVKLLCRQLNEFNFEVWYYNSLDDAKAGIAENPPHLVLLDLTMKGSVEQQVLDFGKELEQQNIRTIVLSAHTSFDLRIGAVCANISAYLVKPANITALVSEIRKVLLLDLVLPFRVCMIDDQESVLSFYKLALEQHGIAVYTSTEPQKLLELLENFEPDIFIFDMNMPNFSGLHLAKLIRQFPKYEAIPILFLSNDNSVQNKLNILEIGCDDLLPKDAPVDVLIRQIKSRIERGYSLRFLATRDSMTGLLNHAQIMDAANYSLQIGLRRNSPVTVVMLDLDHFKKVNDNYGHAAGDKVLMGLGQLLIQSFRETDQLGRYGGEEFMLVCPDSALEEVEKKIDLIRQTFSQLAFNHDGEEFMVTFSAGLACSDAFKELSPLLGAADMALYAAKNNGRNRICCA